MKTSENSISSDPTIVAKELESGKIYYCIQRTNNGEIEYLSITMSRKVTWTTNFNFASTYDSEESAQKAYDLLMKDYKESYIGFGRTKEGKIDYNFWYKFDKQIPHNMRFKQFDIIDGHILYWITYEYFEESDVEQFYNVFKNLHSYTDTAFVICRNETNWDYKKDLKDGVGAYMTLQDGYTMWNESIEVTKELKVPGTNVILEKGDKITLVNKKNEAKVEPEVIFEDSNFSFKKVKFYSSKDGHNFDEEQFTWRVDTKPHSKADDYVISMYVDCEWNNMSIPENIELKYGMRMNGPKGSITEFIRILQDSLKFAEKVASYLKIKVINK